MPSPQTLWRFYPIPFELTTSQLDSNFFRIASSDITPQELDEWKEEFIKRLKLDENRAKYLRGLTLEGLRKKWEEEKPEAITLDHYRKKKRK